MARTKSTAVVSLLMLLSAATGYFGFDQRPSAHLNIPVQPLVGRASVVDGDTIEIRGERIRINGIDAPESAQTCTDGSGMNYRCGAVAAAALAEYLEQSSPTRCEFVDRDRYGRFVGNCRRADGKNVAEWLARNGHALDWPRYSNGTYASHQSAAKKERIGVWSGSFQAPWDWRAEQRGETADSATVLVPEEPATTTPSYGLVSSSCRIKGNIAADGDRIYHMPDQKFYTKTKIATSKGERWFCSEAQARQAGWRPARQ
ncbi:thermonuclease family protein [Aminobacter sp. SR38]|uniref:thermonuclease family protein n=1 Tax=Aminobacter sp. SR38 TaxID=2774562 RepID=UPI001FEFF736|nr:thermonuclease family protein [Aminobacter sp. SR38]